jgi:hypothetical protein
VTLFLFLAHLGIGIILSLAFVARAAGVKFFRFNAGMAAVLIAIALAFRPDVGGGGMPAVALGLLAATEALAVFYWATIGRAFTRYRTFILAAASIAGVVTLVAQALAMDTAVASNVGSGFSRITTEAIASGAAASVSRIPFAAMTIASFLTSAAFLGGACTAMVLGHWYLVLPSMEVSYLQSIVKLHIVSMVLRVVVVVAVVFVAIALWEPGLGPSFRHYILSVSGVFFWQRVLFGLAGPAVLSVLTWETAKIRSTQSATGILYVDFFTVVVGEVLAKYLLLATRVPV